MSLLEVLLPLVFAAAPLAEKTADNGTPTSVEVAAAADHSAGAWEINRTAHEIDGTVDYAAVLKSEKPVFGLLDQPETAGLVIFCGRLGLSVDVVWPDFIYSDLDIDAAAIAWRLDGGNINNELWDADLKVVGRRGRKAKELLRVLATGQRLVIQVPDNHGNQEAAFNLTGLAEIEEAVLAMPCSH